MNNALFTGFWNDLVAFNYAVDPIVLRPYVPNGTELDLFEGHAYISILALCFRKPTLLKSIAIPGVDNVPMITFRFHVKREFKDGEISRGTAFLCEYVSDPFIRLSGMMLGKHDIHQSRVTMRACENGNERSLYYWWGDVLDGNWMKVRTHGAPHESRAGSFEEYTFEKQWDFVSIDASTTLEYEVQRPRWRIWHPDDAELNIRTFDHVPTSVAKELRRALEQPPRSVLVAEGSFVEGKFPSVALDTRSEYRAGL